MCIVQQFHMPKEAGIHEQYGHHALECQLSQPQKWQCRGEKKEKKNQGLCESVLKIMYSLNLEIEAGNNKRLCCSRAQYDG